MLNLMIGGRWMSLRLMNLASSSPKGAVKLELADSRPSIWLLRARRRCWRDRMSSMMLVGRVWRHQGSKVCYMLERLRRIRLELVGCRLLVMDLQLRPRLPSRPTPRRTAMSKGLSWLRHHQGVRWNMAHLKAMISKSRKARWSKSCHHRWCSTLSRRTKLDQASAAMLPPHLVDRSCNFKDEPMVPTWVQEASTRCLRPFRRVALRHQIPIIERTRYQSLLFLLISSMLQHLM